MKQEEALNLMISGHNIFLTGMAGTGKSYLLNKFINYCENNNIALSTTASTGIAATHIGGVTIHSWSGLGIHSQDSLTEDAIGGISRIPYVKEAIKNTKVLIIDEISMLHSYQLDGIDAICKNIKNSEDSFGGIQVILTGDFLQIPPVSKNAKVSYAFESRVWDEANLQICYLEEIFRQDDPMFINLLNEIRQGIFNEDSYSHLATCINKKLEISNPVELYPINREVDSINTQKLNNIKKPEFKYIMKSSGNNGLVSYLKKSCLSPEYLYLKESAHVMFTKNNFDEGYFNGTFGKVVECIKDGVIVELSCGKKVTVTPSKWEIKKFNYINRKYEVQASISQIPLKLAYAITTHKSQGVTLEYAKINLSRLFSFNMGYVALSRVKSLKNLTLTHLDKSIYLVDPFLLEKDKEFKKYNKK